MEVPTYPPRYQLYQDYGAVLRRYRQFCGSCVGRSTLVMRPRSRNVCNVIDVPLVPSATIPKKWSKSAFVPLLLSNVMSLVPKIDEVCFVTLYANYDFVCLVETWLKSHIHKNVVALDGYNRLRRDRYERIHGGVCMYIKDTIKSAVLEKYFV